MLLAALLLLPFLNTPFTIDDPLYLHEARHVLTDPLHPQAFAMIWSTDQRLRASRILPGGVAAPYLLVPTVLAGSEEWVGHLTQLLLLLAAIYATALAALRLGLDAAGARSAALLTAACPAVLGMAGTVMPDIPAMLFVILGMERVLAWRDQRRWLQMLLATLWLTLAALTRTQTIVILPAVFVLLLDGITGDEIRTSFAKFPARFLPLLLTPLLFVLVSWLTADPEAEGENILVTMLGFSGGLSGIARNGCAYLIHLLLAVPLAIPWLVLRWRKISYAAMMVALAGAGVASLRLGAAAFAAAVSAVAMLDILLDALKRRDRVQLALWLWLLLALPAVVYIHLPSKYLLPSVPAVAILILRKLPEAERSVTRWLTPSVATAGAVLGLFILLGIRELARTQRRAVDELILPHTRLYERVWFAGHWGFHWYAEAAGAKPATFEPAPLPGDLVVVSEIDLAQFPQRWTARKVVQTVSYPSGWGSVMDHDRGSGFFSSAYGYLPWTPGSGNASRFEVWKVE